MTFKTEVFEPSTYAEEAASVIANHVRESGSLILTGGTTAEKIYPLLARGISKLAGGLRIGFSDERCVPPDHEASNYRMAKRLFLDVAKPAEVLRMKGEEQPEEGARQYDEAIRPLVDAGIDLLLLGMGADNHIGAMFPGSPALAETERLSLAVDRPDGMKGITLTPPAMLSASRILLLVTGEGKAEAVQHALQGSAPPGACPVRLLADHEDVTFLLDTHAASGL
jgi:6-phosphogluconolactonase